MIKKWTKQFNSDGSAQEDYLEPFFNEFRVRMEICRYCNNNGSDEYCKLQEL